QAIKADQNDADAANKQLQETVKNVDAEREKFEKDVINAVVTNLRASLDNRAQELSRQLDIAEKAPSQPLEDAKKRSGAAQTDITNVEKKIRDANASVTALDPQIERLKRDANIVDQIDKIRENLEAVALAAREAQIQKTTAQNAWDSVKTIKDGLDERRGDIGKLTQQASDQKTQLDALTGRLSEMRKSLDDAKAKLAEFDSLQVDVTLANATVDAPRAALQRAKPTTPTRLKSSSQ